MLKNNETLTDYLLIQTRNIDFIDDKLQIALKCIRNTDTSEEEHIRALLLLLVKHKCKEENQPNKAEQNVIKECKEENQPNKAEQNVIKECFKTLGDIATKYDLCTADLCDWE